MSRALNKAMILGYLGGDAEVRHTTNGDPVASFSVATTDTWKDTNGEKQERTEWHKVTAWKKLAEICGEYLKKGTRVYVEGRLQTRKWDDKTGVTHYATEIVADQLIMLGSGQPKEQRADSSRAGTAGPSAGDDLPF